MPSEISRFFAKATIFIVCGTELIAAQNSFYFATHTSYVNITPTISNFFAMNIAGSLPTVTQQCRRSCALHPHCQAFRVQLLQNVTPLGVFTCRYFSFSACSWTNVSPGSFRPSSILWDKLSVLDMKPKPCVEYCSVKYRGDCQQCRGYGGLTGLDCDIAPKLCSDYASTGWSDLPIWPWGFYGPKLNAYCIEKRTTFLAHLPGNVSTVSTGYMGSSGWISFPYISDSIKLRAQLQEMDWNLLSELVGIAANKELMVLLRNYGDSRYVYSGLQLSPEGHLSLNATVGNAVGLPTPLDRVPFVYNTSCNSFFWEFTTGVSICSQESNLQFPGVKWNGTLYNGAHLAFYMTFS